MSSIRLFILGTLAAGGPLHGHQIRQQAQNDRTETWTDVQVGSVYGALKRLASEDLIREVRTEKVGNRPERTVYEITPEGRRSLAAIHDAALRELDRHYDPFDLALAQARAIPEEHLEQIVKNRIGALRVQLDTQRHAAEAADPYVNEAERLVIQHLIARTEAEICWHTEVAARVPKIAADFAEGIGGPPHLTDPDPKGTLTMTTPAPSSPGPPTPKGEHRQTTREASAQTTASGQTTGPCDATSAPAAPARTTGPGHGWRAVSIVLVGAFMALLDTTIVNVALPSIRTGLHASPASLEWIVSGYALAYGLALVPGGRAGDRFGHKNLFLIGLTIFTLASVACGISQNQGEIVAARIVQGVGAGLFFPAISATIQHSFTGPARSKAFGVLGAVIGVSTAMGPLLGGLIIAGVGSQDGWRWVFLVNLFIGAVAIPMAAWRLPRAETRTKRGFDPVGLGLLTGGLLLLLIPLVAGQQDGWPAWTWICFGCCVVVLALLAAWELREDGRGGDPLLKPGLLRQSSFSAGAVFAIAFFGGFSSTFFTLSILWQEGLGHSALITGLVIAPYSLGTLTAAANSDKLSARLGRLVLVLGCSLLLIGLALVVLVIHLTEPGVNGWDLFGPLLLAGLGTGMTIAPNQDFVLATVPRREAGTAAGILGTSQRLGTAIGIAIIGTVLFGSLKFTPGPHAVANAFTHSAQLALLANLGFMIVALALVLALPREIPNH